MKPIKDGINPRIYEDPELPRYKPVEPVLDRCALDAA
jgi:hypothetical protein